MVEKEFIGYDKKRNSVGYGDKIILETQEGKVYTGKCCGIPTAGDPLVGIELPNRKSVFFNTQKSIEVKKITFIRHKYN